MLVNVILIRSILLEVDFYTLYLCTAEVVNTLVILNVIKGSDLDGNVRKCSSPDGTPSKFLKAALIPLYLPISYICNLSVKNVFSD